ncbi:Spo0E family sporulation regulatory protein-aspartic acid phosphatase [Brevibacillus brevis]
MSISEISQELDEYIVKYSKHINNKERQT